MEEKMEGNINEIMDHFWKWMIGKGYAYGFETKDGSKDIAYIVVDGKQEIYPNRQMLIGYLWQFLEETVAGHDGEAAIDNLFERYMKKLRELKEAKPDSESKDNIEDVDEIESA